MKQLSAIVLCAGKGTRMKSEKAKVLHPLLGQPLACYPLQRAMDLGASRVVAVTGHQADEVETELAARFAQRPLHFARQHQQQGTAHAVAAAESALAEFAGDVLILYGDVPLLRSELLFQFLALHQKAASTLSLVSFVPADPHGYGRLVRESGKLRAVVEEKDATEAQRSIRECNAGIYLADSKFLWKTLHTLKSDNAQGELYLTDLIAQAVQSGAEVPVLEASAQEVAGINDRRELAWASRVLQTRINEAHMLAGVTLQDPSTAQIEPAVEIGADTEIGPHVLLLGQTKIGPRVRIGAGCVLSDSIVGAGSVLKPYSVLEQARVGLRNQIGPFSRLRPGTELAEEVHLGNFVETKKAALGKGTKANHLSYLGDATIGAGCNIGAGTITCNYDGQNKLPTTLGDGVFIGSDTQLVAPVSVGDGAYVGAGTTVVDDVRSGALALSRVPQKNIEGWVGKHKRKK